MADVLAATLATWARGLSEAAATASPLDLIAGAAACYVGLVSRHTHAQTFIRLLRCSGRHGATQPARGRARERRAETSLNPRRRCSHLLSLGTSPSPSPQLVWQMLQITDRIKYRHIPSDTPLPLLGNLWTVGGWGGHKRILWNAYSEWRGRHGKVFKWISAQQTFVVFAGEARGLRARALTHSQPRMRARGSAGAHAPAPLPRLHPLNKPPPTRADPPPPRRRGDAPHLRQELPRLP